MAAAYKPYGNYGEPMDQSGGFLNSPTQGGSPAGGRKPVNKAQNVVPMAVSQILKCVGGDIMVENTQVAIIVLLGTVKDIQFHAGRTSFNLDDKSGIIEITHFHDDDTKQESNLEAGALIRVVGHYKEFQGKKSVMAISIRVCTSLNELTCHLLEVLYTPLKLKQIQMKQLEKSGVTQQAQGALPNSMMAPLSALDAGSSVAGFRPNEQRVYMIIRNCSDDMGIHKDEIIKQCDGVVNPKEINTILDMMTTEGHIFSTVNDDTFRSTEQ